MFETAVFPASPLWLLAVGFALGARHALDPDHVVAVTTIVTRERTLSRARMVGAMWGIGHSLTVFLVGGTLALFRVTVPARVGLALEFLVAVMLVVLGVANLMRSKHVKAPSSTRPLAVGFVHGLAGSAAIAVLLSAAAPTLLGAALYLLLFGAGTVAGMMLLTTLIAAPTVLLAGRYAGFGPRLRFVSGVASVVLGLFIAHDVGITDGLFSALPPR